MVAGVSKVMEKDQGFADGLPLPPGSPSHPLAQRKNPGAVTCPGFHPVPTYGGDTVLRLPRENGDERLRLRQLGERFMQIQYDAEALHAELREQTIIEALKALEGGQES